MNLYMFEVKKSIPIQNDDRYINWISVVAETEEKARNVLFEEFHSKEWFDKEYVSCTEIALNKAQIIDYGYDV